MDRSQYFSGIVVAVPSDVERNEAGKHTAPLEDDPVKVWMVFSPEPLTQDQFQTYFLEIDVNDVVCSDWLGAFPQYLAPYETPSFILDDGVFYINAMEMVATSMECCAVGAKNAALLTRNYLLRAAPSV